MERLANAAKSPSAAIAGLHNQLRGVSRLVMGGVLGYGFGQLVKGLIGVNSQTELTTIGLAMMEQAAMKMQGKLVRFPVAIQGATDVLKELRQVAIDTPATFDQVSEAYKSMFMVARGAGMNPKAIAQLAGDVATADMAEGGTGLLTRDISQVMRGSGKVDSVYLRPYAPQIKKLVKKGDQKGAMDVIQKALTLDPAARKAFGESYEGQMSTFQDQLQQIQREAGKPLFEAANGVLKKMSAWLVKNREKVSEIATAVGKGLVKAFTAVKDLVVWLYESGVGKFALGIYGLVKATELLKGVFGSLSGVFSMLAKHPFFIVLAGAIAAVAFLMGKGKPADISYVPEKDRLTRRQRLEAIVAGGEGYEVEKQAGVDVAGIFKDGKWIGTAAGGLKSNPNLPGSAWFNDKYGGSAEKDILHAQMAKYLGVEDPARSEAMKELAKMDAADAKAAQDSKLKAMTLREGHRGNFVNMLAESKLTKVNAEIDARGAKITVITKLTTDDPARFADASLKSAFIGTVARPLSATFGLGMPSVGR
jgi:hypothetical protein